MKYLKPEDAKVYLEWKNFSGEIPKFKDMPRPIVRIFQKYSDQKSRCYNKNHRLYPKYGGKGLTVDYTAYDFLVWFLRKYPEFYRKYPNNRPSVGRVDHDKGYSLDNIEIQTVAQNTAECIKRNGNPSPYGTKLNLDSVKKIRKELAKGITLRDLAEKYGVTKGAISAIKTGRNWKNV